MATTTTDHKKIRAWIEERGGVPATVEETARESDEVGILRVDFPAPDSQDSNLMTISWDDFFAKFDEAKLAFLHEEKTSGGDISRFSKFVSR